MLRRMVVPGLIFAALLVWFHAPAQAQQQMIGQINFEELDAKKDGKVTPDEALAYFQNHAQPWAQAFFKRLDADGKGYVTKENFAAALKGRRVPVKFEDLDTKKDGKVTSDELVAYFQSHTKPWAAAWVKRLDADGKGYVTKDDIQKLRARGKGNRAAGGGDTEDN